VTPLETPTVARKTTTPPDDRPSELLTDPDAFAPDGDPGLTHHDPAAEAAARAREILSAPAELPGQIVTPSFNALTDAVRRAEKRHHKVLAAALESGMELEKAKADLAEYLRPK